MKHTNHCSPLPPNLPAPDEIAAAHCARVFARICEEIEHCGGAIPFSRFMDLAQYAPGLGYYTAGSRKFGAEGDFVTAPELSPLFGQCLARQIGQVLAEVENGEILELGAGSGALARVLIDSLVTSGVELTRYCILDISPDLRQRQQEHLADCELYKNGGVQWLDSWPEQPFNGVVIANEVLDAMPVEVFRISDGAIEQAFVVSAGQTFAWEFRPAGMPLADRVAAVLPGLPDGYVSEINIAVDPWMRALGESISSGAAFFIDYGFSRNEYYHSRRDMGTLMCHYRHRAHPDPLILPGLQDITAHVDFSAVAQAGEDAGFAVLGYTTQANFLLANGLLSFIEQSDPNDVRAHLELARQVQKLTSPSEMGELFKVLALGKGIDGPLAGFAMRDMSGRLKG